MIKFRIKEKEGRFYPQYHKGFRTLWCWEYFIDKFNRTPSSNYNAVAYAEWGFTDLEGAEEFIKKEKEKIKARAIKIHEY